MIRPAAQAISQLHGEKMGTQTISVTLHEPRKLRPEKLMERELNAEPTSYGRRVTTPRGPASPFRDGKRGKREDVDVNGARDTIRTLSPASRRVALGHRISSFVRRYMIQHGIPDEYLEPAVKALVRQDLALIPLLHDFSALEAKMAETLSVLQDDPENAINLCVNLPARAEMVIGNEASPKMDITDKQTSLRTEVKRMSPDEIDDVVPVMLRMMEPRDIDRCLENDSFLARRYNTAKKELNRRQESFDTDDTGRSSPVQPDTPAGRINLNGRSPEVTSLAPLAIDGLTISKFALMTVHEMTHHLEGSQGAEIYEKLNIPFPGSVERDINEAFKSATLCKTVLQRKLDITHRIVQACEVSSAWAYDFRLTVIRLAV